jgi:hypothetical protein
VRFFQPEKSMAPKFLCEVPRNASDMMNIATLERELFGGMALSVESALNLYEFCPEIYSALYCEGNTIAGYSSVFPMKAEYAEEFIAGRLTEPELQPHMLLPPSAPDFQRSRAYVGSVVVRDDYGLVTRSILLAGLLSWRMTQMTHLSLRRMPVFMMAVSEQGSQMVRFVGAKKLNDGAIRKDGKAIYGRTVTPGFLTRANASLQRCMSAGLVQMRFDNCHKAKALETAPV